jgi:hypothetical protein
MTGLRGRAFKRRFACGSIARAISSVGRFFHSQSEKRPTDEKYRSAED